MIPKWLDEMEIVPSREEITVRMPEAASISRLQATEEAYFNLMNRLHDVFGEYSQANRYEELAMMLNRLNASIK